MLKNVRKVKNAASNNKHTKCSKVFERNFFLHDYHVNWTSLAPKCWWSEAFSFLAIKRLARCCCSKIFRKEFHYLCFTTNSFIHNFFLCCSLAMFILRCLFHFFSPFISKWSWLWGWRSISIIRSFPFLPNFTKQFSTSVYEKGKRVGEQPLQDSNLSSFHKSGCYEYFNFSIFLSYIAVQFI